MRTSVKQDQDFIKEIIDSSALETAIEFIKNNFSAEEIYGMEHMRLWAEENGYSDEDEA